MKILVSACLLGDNCKYNGGNNYSKKLETYLQGKEYVKVCPEMLAVHQSPRTPIEILNNRLVDKNGNDVEDVFQKGVDEAMKYAQDVDIAILKSRSPTCGVHQIYDGTFTGTLVNGSGKFAQKLKEKGIKVIDIEDIEE